MGKKEVLKKKKMGEKVVPKIVLKKGERIASNEFLCFTIFLPSSYFHSFTDFIQFKNFDKTVGLLGIT